MSQAAVERPRVVVLASGSGSNFQALVDASASGVLAADIVCLITDRPDAFAIRRALHAGVDVRTVSRATGEDRRDYDARLADAVGALRPDLVVLAGWMRLLSMNFLGRFPERVVNLHPALPGEFPGTNAIERALQAAQSEGLRRTGVMIHFVPDEGMDDGPVVASVQVAIEADDTIEKLAGRVHAAEHALLVETVNQLVRGRPRRSLSP